MWTQTWLQMNANVAPCLLDVQICNCFLTRLLHQLYNVIITLFCCFSAINGVALIIRTYKEDLILRTITLRTISVFFNSLTTNHIYSCFCCPLRIFHILYVSYHSRQPLVSIHFHVAWKSNGSWNFQKGMAARKSGKITPENINHNRLWKWCCYKKYIWFAVNKLEPVKPLVCPLQRYINVHKADLNLLNNALSFVWIWQKDSMCARGALKSCFQ